MTCIPMTNGVLCVGAEPVSVTYREKTFYFEWHGCGGWLACNKDGSERKAPIPIAVWDLLEAEYGQRNDKPPKPLSKKHVVPCPKCGAGWPTVQAMRDGNAIVCVCSHCGIEGTISEPADSKEAAK